MDYHGFYEQNNRDENGEHYEPALKGKRSAGAVVFVVVMFLLIAVLLAYLVIPGLRRQLERNVPPFPWPGTTQGLKPVTPAPTPRVTPDLEDMPEFDGTGVTVTDPYNPFPDIVEAYKEGVVGIINYANYKGLDGEEYEMEQSGGSGFVISSQGYIVTNAHVVKDAGRLGVVFADGTEVSAMLRGMDTFLDVAVLKVEREGLTALKLGTSSTVRTAEQVVAIGDPTGQRLSGTTTFGIISSKARLINIDGRNNTYLQVDAAVNPGNSGGPLINGKGEVIGVVAAKTLTAGYDEMGQPITAEGIGFAIPIDDAMRIVEELIRFGYIERPGIGISVITLTPDQRNEGEPEGILVASVTEGGPADAAGLKEDDIIVECNGVVLFEQEEFVKQVQACRVGDELNIKYYRNGQYQTCVIVVGDLNDIG